MKNSETLNQTLCSCIDRLSDCEEQGLLFIDSSSVERFVSYQQFRQRALVLLAHFQDKGLRSGDQLVIQTEENEQLLTAFWACILGGIVPVPLSIERKGLGFSKLQAVWGTLDHPFLFSETSYLETLLNAEEVAENLKVNWQQKALVSSEINWGHAPAKSVKAKPADLAFIQFSSGSTGRPKGVMLSHSNLIHNITDCVEVEGITKSSRGVSWIPLTHDLGMIGFHLSFLAAGASQYIMPTHLFIRRPLLWLEKASEHKATTLYCPNFGLKYYLNALGKVENQDLSLDSIRNIINGAEPISARICAAFIQQLEPYGLSPNCIQPSYGLAEASVGVSTTRIDSPLREIIVSRSKLKLGKKIELEDKATTEDTVGFIDLGAPFSHTQLRVCSDTDQELAPLHLGNIQIKGANVTKGYYNNAEATAAVFTDDGWLRTGDLGFLLENGHVVITGRKKNIIILQGQNYYPHDIEAVITELEEVDFGKVAALGIPGTASTAETLVLFVAVRQKLNKFVQLVDKINQQLTQVLGFTAAYVIPIRRLPKTTSGKVQHFKLLQEFQAGKYNQLALDIKAIQEEQHQQNLLPKNKLEQQIQSIWQQVLNHDHISTGENFFAMGGNSLLAFRLVSILKRELGISLGIRDIFTYPTISQLATELASQPLVDVESNLSHHPTDALIPLSFTQEGVWMTDKLGGSYNYHIPMLWHLHGALEVDKLRAAFAQVIDRHESLRTLFQEEEGIVIQQAQPANHWALHFEKRTGQSADQSQLIAEFEAASREAFNLSEDFPIRASLYEVGKLEYYLLVTIHHIAFDGGSIPILLQELQESYAALKVGREVMSRPVDLQYRDYAYWQRQEVSKAEVEDKLNYWEERLSDMQVLDFPTDYLRPHIQSKRGANLEYSLSSTLTAGLGRICEEENVTMYMLLLATFKVLLYRYSGQKDITIGSVFANRSQLELESMIGFFANIFPLRSQLEGEAGFKDYLNQIKEASLEAYQYQDVPFTVLADRIEPYRDLSRNPIFQIAFAWQDASTLHPLGLHDVEVTPEDFHNKTSKFDITFNAVEQSNGIHLSLEYCTALFEASTIARLLSSYQRLLESIVADRNQSLNELRIIDAKQEQLLLETFNATDIAYPSDQPLTALFKQQVVNRPESIAAVQQGVSITYAELDYRSNQLARYLKEQGVEHASMVGLYVERSIEMLIGVLAILKAGGVYVPIDTKYPSDRVNYIISDAALTLLLVDSVSQTRIETDLEQFVLDDLSATLRGVSGEPLARTKHSSEDLAYMIYTSGSTGRPKGVLITQKAINRLVFNPDLAFLNSESVIYQYAPLAFDASTFEIWGAWLHGGKVVLASAKQDSLEQMTQEIRENGVTTLFLTTALFHVAVEAHISLFASLQQVLAGGEIINPGHVKTLLTTYPNLQYYIAYGPTESTTYATLNPITSVENIDFTHNNIGKPIGNTKAYVLDPDSQRLSPIGCPGELFLSGPGLAVAYKNLPEFSAERFMENPYDSGAFSRLYRTGDIVRWLPDGNIAFIGRKDNQVKIRGYRVELGEIEAVLQKHHFVSQCVVLAQVNEQGLTQIVAYIVPSDQPFDHDRLFEYLQNRLPEYMIPWQYLTLDALPLTQNGKIDKKALPAIELSPTVVDEYVAPQTAMEEKLVDIWQAFLGADRIGTEENFFTIGGNSLLAFRLVAVLKKALGVSLGVKDIFRYPTIRQLATELASKPVVDVESNLNRRPAGASIPLSFAQEGVWMTDKLGGSHNYHIPLLWQLQGEVEIDKLQLAFTQVIARHESLRTLFVESEGAVSQQVQPAEHWTLRYENWVGESTDGDQLIGQLAAASREPFHLSEDFPIRASLYEVGQSAYYLLVTLHHIAFDGGSIPLLLAELQESYAALKEGLEVSSQSIDLQYGDYAYWQRTEVSQAGVEAKLGYWVERLSDMEMLDFPTDHLRPHVQSKQGSNLDYRLPSTLTPALRRICEEENVTMYMLLLAAFKVLLYRYSGQKDMTIGSVFANRNQLELEPMIGFFANIFPLRSQVEGVAGFKEYLQQIKESTLEAYQYQDVPFTVLADRIEPYRDLSRNPIFQIVFAWQDASTRHPLELRDVEVTAKAFHNKTSKFDITFNAVEQSSGIYLSLEYCSALFEESTITRLLSSYHRLLESIVLNSDQALNKLRIIDTKQEQQLLETFNATATAYPSDQPLMALFAQQVSDRPQSIAAVQQGESITYAEMDYRSNQLARHLQEQGVKHASLVGLYVDRSIEMLIGVLGILKAGGVYVPIDTKYPSDRVNYIISDAALSLLLVDTASQGRIQTEIRQLVLDDLSGTLSGISGETVANTGHSSEDLAYMIYTSGSTGRPKGVLITQKAVNRLVFNSDLDFLNAESVIYQYAPLAFDASTFEIWGALLHGGKVVLASASDLTMEEIGQELQNGQVNTLWLTAGLFHQAVAEHLNIFEGLSYLLAGGDKIESSAIQRLLAQHKDLVFINGYGPTESTTFAVTNKLSTAKVAAQKGDRIGYPIGNTKAYVLNFENQQLVPVGCPGELCLSGPGLALGYQGLPALTGERFIANPYGQGEYGRLYKTGDRVKWLADGSLQFLGRIDNQIKIRGYRVELNEIETVVKSFNPINECLVIQGVGLNNRKLLLAYFTAALEGLESITIKKYLAGVLPEYMIPTLFVQLEEFPLNRNGKIDRSALPQVDIKALLAGNYVAPRTLVEKHLAEVWGKILQTNPIGIHDNFFELGGDSILSLQVVSNLRKYGYQIRPRNLFECPTIAQLTELLQASQDELASEQGMLEGEASLLPIQHWFFEQEYKDLSHFNQAVLLEVDKEIREETLRVLIKAILQQNDALRFQFTARNRSWKQNYGIGKTTLEHIDLSKEAEEGFSSKITEVCNRTQAQLNILEGELMQVAWIETPVFERANRLFLAVHHLAIDTVSWRIILHQLQQGIEQYQQGQEICFGDKSTSYREWAAAMQSYAVGEEVVSQIPYWIKMRDQGQPLPLDHATPSLETSYEQHQVVLSKERCDDLLQAVNHAFNTNTNDILISALAQTISDWCGYKQLVIGLEGHGREDVSEVLDVSDTVGWFTSMYPVALEIDASISSGNLIKSIKEQLRKIPGNGLGYGLLRYLHPDQAVKESMAGINWDIAFNYLGRFDNLFAENNPFGLASESVGNSYGSNKQQSAKLDLTCSIINGELKLNWNFSTADFELSTIRVIAQAYLKNLETIIDFCKSCQFTSFTPFDFDIHEFVSYSELDGFLDAPDAQSIKAEEEVPIKDKIEDLYRLSPLQEGMLFNAIYDEDSEGYIVQFVIDFEGDIDTDLFQETWRQLIQKHTILRSSFIHDQLSIPIQAVYRQVDLPYQYCDFSSFLKEICAKEVDTLKKREFAAGFDFQIPPLMRISLVKTAENQFKMIWTCLHMLLDGWSMPVIIGELLQTYHDLKDQSTLPALPVDKYGDYIRYIDQSNKLASEQFWRTYLEGFEQASLLPFSNRQLDRNKGRNDSAESSLILNGDLTSKLLAYGQDNSITMNTILQGAWGLLVSSYSSSKDVVFGVTVSGRPSDLDEAERRVGLYINTLPLRVQVQGEAELTAWLQEIQQGHVRGREHQYTPLNKVQQWSGIRGEFFDSILVFENYPLGEVMDQDHWYLKATKIEIREWKEFLFAMAAYVESGQLKIKMHYDRTMLDVYFVDQIKSQLEGVLAQMVSAEVKQVEEIELLPPALNHLLVEEFSATARSYPQQATMVSLIENQVGRTPDGIALIHGDVELSYAELNRRADKLAYYLQRTYSIEADDLIGVMMDRSDWMIVSILGILKSGAAYVPIDVSLPKDRKSYIISNSGLKALVIDSSSLFELGDYTVPAVVLDIQYDSFEEGIVDKEICRPDSLGYVIYTSGSTGKPKGVMIEHRSNVNMALDQISRFEISPADRILQFASLSFDASVYEIFMALYSGASLVLATDSQISDSQHMLDYIRSKQVSVVTLPPAYLRVLPLDELSFLRVIVTAGEAAHTADALHCAAFAQYYNAYGPTECAVCISTYRVQGSEAVDQGLPIGKPLSNTRFYVLDEALRLVPPGVPGQLWVSGAGLARGYLNQAELTGEKFLPNPYEGGEQRMYGTGDIVRWLPDGNLEFRGRSDSQIKLRGYRIELDEIETTLLQYEDLQEVVVQLRLQEGRPSHLEAYLLGDVDLSVSDLRQYLQGQLPGYMIPAQFHVLSAFPRTNSGKVDKAALFELVGDRLGDEGEQSTARTELEQALLLLWQEVLQIDRLGIHDNFFEQGGDSIVSIQLVGRLRKLGYQVRPRDIFEYSTVAQLAEYLGTAQGQLKAEQGKLEGAVSLLGIQHWFFEQSYQHEDHYNQAVLLNLDKGVEASTLEQCLTALLDQHDALGCHYEHRADGIVQLYGAAVAAIQVAQVSTDSSVELPAMIESICEEHQRSLSLAQGELVRFVLIQTPDSVTHNRLFIVVHHLVFDGVSWRILLSQLAQCLEQLSLGQALELGEKSSSYREWSAGMQAYASSYEMEQQIAYWSALSTEREPLPYDHDQAVVTRANDHHYDLQLDSELTENLLQQVNQAYNTEINDILLTALATTMDEWTGQQKVVIGLEGHGRDDVLDDLDTSSTIGWFTSLYPVCLTLDHDWSISDRIKSIKEQLRRIPSKGLGYGVLRYLHPEEQVRDRLSGVGWDIGFNYLGQFDNAITQNEWFSLSSDPIGASMSPDEKRSTALEINCTIIQGSLLVNWTYSRQQFEDATIEELAQRFMDNLIQVIDHCQAKKETSLTPSDFGLSKAISFQELDQFLANKTVVGTGTEFNNANVAIQHIYGLSPLQEGMLFHSLFEDDSKAYINQLTLDFPAGVEVSIFKQAWEHVLHVHSVLRSSFVYDQLSIPVQCVYDKVELPLFVQDYSALSGKELVAAIHHLKETDYNTLFDFEEPPLLRMTLVKTGPIAYHLIFSHHHILLDGWSMPIIVGQFLETYEALCKEATLPALSTDEYGDYIRYIDQSNKLNSEQFWRTYLEGFEQASLLPFSNRQLDRNKGRNDSAESSLILDANLTSRLLTYGQDNNVTMNTILQGAWGLLVSSYSSSNDVVFGVTVSGRPSDLDEADSRVGLYINTLPLRIQVQSEEKLSTWLQSIQHSHVLCREHQYTPLNKIQQWSGIRGDFFDSMLVFENYPLGEVMNQEHWYLKATNIEIREWKEFLFAMAAYVESGQLTIKMHYDTFVLDRFYVEQIKDQLVGVLEQIVDPDIKHVGRISLVSDQLHHQLLDAFNSYHSSYPEQASMVSMFEEQVSRTPDHIALIRGEVELSYKELNKKANKLAYYLQSTYAPKADDLIGVMMDRSEWMIVAILGILKSGAAYVPIDISLPKERKSYIISNSGLKVMVIDSSSLFEMGEYELPAVALDIQFDSFEEGIVDSSKIRSGDLGYVIYTSGSTGKPKGVMIEQGSNVNMSLDQILKFEISPSDRILQFASLSFDASVSEIFMALYAGASLVLATDAQITDSQRLLQYMSAKQVSVVTLPPAYLRVLPLNDLSFLRVIITAGEAAYTDDALDCTVFANYYNAYGPTECAVCVSTYKVKGNESIDQPLPIGKPLANTRFYVLDESLRLVPPGVPGQLWVSGVGLARGYLNQDELTAAKFRNNPYEGPGSRMYGTGDTVRWLPSGNLEFRGRSDNQIKLRGYRIELSEIETTLLQYEQLDQAVVHVRRQDDRPLYLEVYLLAKAGLSIEELQKYLQAQLPSYMVPSKYHLMSSFPMTTSGKVDKQSLVNLVGDSQGDQDQYEAARTELEAQLLVLWQEVLQLNRLGIHDSFFEQGGDSIVSIQLVGRLRKVGYQVRPRDIFDNPTVATLAEYLGTAKEQIKAEQGKLEGSVPLLGIQHWFFEQGYRNENHYNQAVLLNLDKEVEAEALRRCLSVLLEQHDALRCHYERRADGIVQVYGTASAKVHIEEVSTISTDGLEATIESICEQHQRSLSLVAGELMRFVLIQTPGESTYNRLFIVVHHLVFDGVSWRILLSQLAQCLAQLSLGQPLELGEKSSSYREWAVGMEAYASSYEMEQQIDYWSALFTDRDSLPYDHEEVVVTRAHDHHYDSQLDRELTQHLLQQVNQAYNTEINDILLTALATTLAEWTGQQKIVIGLEGHGRDDVLENLDTSSTIGWFTSLYPVSLQLDHKCLIADRIKSIKEQLRRIPTKGLGYGVLRYLHPEEQVRHRLAGVGWDIGFNYLGQFDNAITQNEWFSLSSDPIGASMGPDEKRSTALEINSTVIQGRLLVNWTYSRQHFEDATIEKIAQRFMDNLTQIIEHCRFKEDKVLTPSDFDLGDAISVEEFDELFGLGEQEDNGILNF